MQQGKTRGNYMSNISFEICEARTRDDLIELEKFQRITWDYSDKDVIGANELGTIQKNGGIVLMALDKFNKDVIGSVASMPALLEDSISQHTLIVGVMPKARLKGIGYKLLLELQKQANRRGIETLSTYVDPLDSILLYLLLVKFSGKSRTYLRNFFGSNLSGLCGGMETDRVLITWNSNEQKKQELDYSYLFSNQNVITNFTEKKDGYPVSKEIILNLHAPNLLVEIPKNIYEIKKTNPEIATHWRYALRDILERYIRSYEIDSLAADKKNNKLYLVLSKIEN